jgi:uncharacterized protein (DUF1330 family)
MPFFTGILSHVTQASRVSLMQGHWHRPWPISNRIRLKQSGEVIMNRPITVGLAMLAGAALGGAAVEALHAQAKPPVYQIVEIDIDAKNQEAYVKDYAPKAQAAIKGAGGKFLAAGGKTTTIEGEPPKSRIVIQQWDSVAKIQAYRNSAAFKDLLPLREKLAKFRSFAVEGLPQ